MSDLSTRCYSFCFVACTLIVWPSTAHAQQITAEAYTGLPYGVGRVTMPSPSEPLPPGELASMMETRAYQLSAADGRLFYPAFAEEGSLLNALSDSGLLGNNGGLLGNNGGLSGNNERVSGNEGLPGDRPLLGRGRRRGATRRLGDGRLLGRLRDGLRAIDSAVPQTSTVYFLFRGEEPLELALQSSSYDSITVVPQDEPRAHRQLFSKWWQTYRDMLQRQTEASDYPPLVETYLAHMLAARWGLDGVQSAERSEPREALDLILGTEQQRQRAMQQTLTGRRVPDRVANLPVPAEPAWAELPLLDPAAQPEIEPIAHYVPEECLYIRFGTFANYLWMNQLMEDYGGDISRMVKLRGHQANPSERLQRQLALKQSALAEILGGQVISDVALIGRDLFLREGAAMGILFEARNPLLKTDIDRQRNEAFHRERQNGAVMETVVIDGHDVSFLSTPDNRLRSFYAVKDNYHLVTTSHGIVARFLQAADGNRSLGESAEFANARSAMPVSREDTIFVYLSSRFFQGLAGPQYQIELQRRLQAVTDIELVKLARLAAAAEALPGHDVADLVAAGLLPPGLQQRVDGSRPQIIDGELYDSLRGARGTFLPVTDVPLVAVTADESRRYRRLAEFYQTHWQQTDPLMVGIKRWALEQPRRERVVIDAWMLPFDAQQYGLVTSMIGEPSTRQITSVADDVVSVQATMRGGMWRPSVGTHHLFLGLQDMAVDPALASGGSLLQTLSILRGAPGYLGAWPKPGLLDLIPAVGGQPDALGYSQVPVLGLWRRQFGDFSVLSFVPSVLESVTPQLTVDQTDSQAQIRVRVADLSDAKVKQWLNDLYYRRARQASINNARFLHTLSQQLAVPRQDARAVAEDLLDVQLTCALGGEYQLRQHPSGLMHWASSSWELENNRPTAAPPDYEAPPWEWFRGLVAELTMYQDKLMVHAELDMQRKASESKLNLPLFDRLFGNKNPQQQNEPQPPAVPRTPPAEPLPEPLPPPPTSSGPR
jgi:hypothetical protein